MIKKDCLENTSASDKEVEEQQFLKSIKKSLKKLK